MKLATIVCSGREVPVAIREEDGSSFVISLQDVDGVDSLAQLLADDGVLARVRAHVAAASVQGAATLAEVMLAPPVRPSAIYCLGHNYGGHLAAGVSAPTEVVYPNVFVKTPNTVVAPGGPVLLPSVSDSVDYEGEIAVVIGRGGKDIPEAEAADHIAGYTLLNDVSARDWQNRGSQWALGKCFDTFSPFGPTIVTPDELDPDGGLAHRTLRTFRGAELVQEISTDAMVFSPAYLVHYLSQVVTLEPGDLIATGTPAKLPQARERHTPLRDGDTVTIELDGLDSLTTRFAASR